MSKMNSLFKKRFLNNPRAGDVWQERFQIAFLIIGVISNFIIISKAYAKPDSSFDKRFIDTDPCKFTVITKEEFISQTKFCDPLLVRTKWIALVKSINLPKNLLDNEYIKQAIENKMSQIQTNFVKEIEHLKNPQPGDVWTLQDKKCIVILDLYLNENLIISYCDISDIDKILQNLNTFLDIRVVHKEEFKFVVLIDNNVTSGFSASVNPEYLKAAVELFKLDN